VRDPRISLGRTTEARGPCMQSPRRAGEEAEALPLLLRLALRLAGLLRHGNLGKTPTYFNEPTQRPREDFGRESTPPEYYAGIFWRIAHDLRPGPDGKLSSVKCAASERGSAPACDGAQSLTSGSNAAASDRPDRPSRRSGHRSVARGGPTKGLRLDVPGTALVVGARGPAREARVPSGAVRPSNPIPAISPVGSSPRAGVRCG
jgi:hypothetical protein